MNEPQHISGSIKAVAGYEIVKGAGAILTALALWMWHKQLLAFINTANSAWISGFGSLFESQINSLVLLAQRAAQNWQLFMVVIFGYATLRFIEAYGLLKDRAWAYWFSVLGYGLFIPMEVYYLFARPFDWFKLFILLLNIIVVFVVYQNMRKKGLI